MAGAASAVGFRCFIAINVRERKVEFMGVKISIKTCLNYVLSRYGDEIVPTEILYEWQRIRVDKPGINNRTLSDVAARYLKPDNPKLVELQQRYRAFDSDVTTP